MNIEQSQCAIERANDAAVSNELFACGPCSVRAFQDEKGIVQAITRNVCQRLLLGDAASNTTNPDFAPVSSIESAAVRYL